MVESKNDHHRSSSTTTVVKRGKRFGCLCRKEDFFLEESFKSWNSYVKALGETRMRLKDRLTTRSNGEQEVNEMRDRSQHQMKKTLNWWDLIWFGFGAVFGAGIFVLTGLEARRDAGPAIVLSFLISGVSAMLCMFCYTEFGCEIPVAGILLCTTFLLDAASFIRFGIWKGGLLVYKFWLGLMLRMTRQKK